MEPVSHRASSPVRNSRALLSLVCIALLAAGDPGLLAQQASPTAAAPADASGKLSPEQLDSLVAPIALYADPLLAQTLAASTYPLEIIQLQQWLQRNPNLKDKALVDAVAKQPWDPSVQSMAAFPEVVKRLSDDIQWTTDLGNAFLAQQGDVMNAVQRMRAKAKTNGALKTTEQQKVEVQVIEQKEVIIVQPASPEVIYVPSYSPTVVYGPPVYPYPPIYYPPPPPPGTAFVAFSFGVMMGAAWGGACCGCGWGHNDVNININNNFNKNTNINRNVSTGNSWQHNSAHRGGTPYANQATAAKYGGTARGDSLSQRQAAAQQQQARAGAQQQGRAGTSPSAASRPAGSAGAGASPSASTRSTGGAGAAPSSSDRSAGSSSRSGASGTAGVSPTSSKAGGGFGDSGGFSGSNARASSTRGAGSVGSGGGGSRKR